MMTITKPTLVLFVALLLFPLPPDWKCGLYPITLEGRTGFMNESGAMVIPQRFDATRGFSEGLAAVLVNGRWASSMPKVKW